MDKVEQKHTVDILIESSGGVVHIKQKEFGDGLISFDRIVVERSSLPALIAALQKHVEG